jgi:hypothetical protein
MKFGEEVTITFPPKGPAVPPAKLLSIPRKKFRLSLSHYFSLMRKEKDFLAFFQVAIAWTDKR